MFGRDRLIDRDAAADARDALVEWAVDVTAGSSDKLVGPDQLRWLRIFDADIDNLRTAMQWSQERGFWAEGLAIAGELHRYWFDRSAREGQAWLTRFLSGSGDERTPPAVGAQARMALGHLLQVRGDDVDALRVLEAAGPLFREIGDSTGRGWALNYAGRARWGLGDHQASLDSMIESVDEFTKGANEFGMLTSKVFIANLQAAMGRPDVALELASDLDWSRVDLSPTLAAHADEYAFIYHAVAGAPEHGRERLHTAMQSYSTVGDHPCVAHALDTTAHYASTIGDIDAMATLHGAACQLWDDAGVVVPPWERMFSDTLDRLCHEAFGDRTHDGLLARGAEIGVHGAVQLAIEITSAPT